jgi:type II secretory pathway component PulF
MPTYSYKAADSDGAMVEGKYLAPDRAGVIRHLEQLDMIPVSVSDDQVGNATMKSKLDINLFDGINNLDRITIVRNLAAATKSGLDILQALDILTIDATKKKIRTTMSGVKASMQNGQSLADAFAAQPNVLNKSITGMIRAGESTGRLAFTLDEVSTNLARDNAMSRKIRSAFAYPAILLSMSAAVVALLLGFVLPRLQSLFASAHTKLPLVTRVMSALSSAFTWSPALDIAILVVLVTAVITIQRSEKGREQVLRILFHIPLIREVMKKLALVRFTRTLGYMIGSGTSITEALILTSDAVGNPYYKDAILDAEKQLQIGVPFSGTFEKYKDLFPHFLISLITVGEKTGTLETVLKTFANFYEEEVEAALKDMTNVIEPILLVVMGLIVGSVVMSVLLPIYQLTASYT